MKNLKFLFSVVAIFIMFVGFNSCSKDDKKVAFDSQFEFRSSFTMPTVSYGILKFSSKSHLSTYIQETLSMDDDDRIDLEDSIGFNSLYSIINEIDEVDIGLPSVDPITEKLETKIINGIELYEVNSIYQIVLNQYHELWVGNDIYKYIGRNLVVKTTAQYVNEIIDIRNGNGPISDNIEVIDFTKDSTIVLEPRTRHICQMFIYQPVPQSNNTVTYLNIGLLDSDGVLFSGVCGAKITIDWGDGPIVYLPENSNVKATQYHNYPLPSFNTCVHYNVKVTVEISPNSLCNFYQRCDAGGEPLIFESTMHVKVCNPATCEKVGNKRAEVRIHNHIYNNNNNRAEFFLGYNLDDNWFREPRAWGRIIHFKKDGSKWKKEKPNHKLEMKIHGEAFENNCDDESAKSFNNTADKRTKDFKHSICLDCSGSVNDFTLRSDRQLLIDRKVFHLGATTSLPENLNHPFFPH